MSKTNRQRIPRATVAGSGACRRFLACVLAAALAVACMPSFFASSQAYAEVRRADVVLGSTVEERGLAVARCPSIDATYAIVLGEDGTVYFERDADTQTQIASITKVMTAIVALEYADLDTQITVSENAASIGESTGGLVAGDVLTLENALKVLLVSSGNDAAVAIAESLGATMPGGSPNDADASMAAFVSAMNEKAAALGMANSVFENPHGLDFDAFAGSLHSTARDVGSMCAYAMQNEVFRGIVALAQTSVPVTREGEEVSIDLTSTDQLIGSYDGACGIKTGFTALAGQCFAGACFRDGEYYYAIVLNSSSEGQRFTDTQTLFDWVFEHEITYPLAHSDETVAMVDASGTRDVPVIAEVACASWIDKTVKATLADPEAAIEINDLNGNISQELTFDTVEGDVRVGDKVGTITFYQRNEVVATQDLVAAEEVLGPDFFEGIGIWWDRLFRSFSGDDGVASSRVVNETPLLVDKTSTAS